MSIKANTLILRLTFILLCLSISEQAASSDYQVAQTFQNSTTIILKLRYTGDLIYYVKPSSPIVKNLIFTLQCLTYQDFSFKIVDADKKRFEIFEGGVYPLDPKKGFSFPILASSIAVNYTNKPFSFTLIRKSTNDVIFSTVNKKFIYSDYYIQIGTEISSNNIFGLGQRFSQGLRVKDGTTTLFNRGLGQKIDAQRSNLASSSYPFYLIFEDDTNSHINYFRNSNAMDVIKQKIDDKYFLTFKTIGGVIDFRLFLEDYNFEQLIQNFHSYIGKSTLPPFWALGYHQSRWGYKDINSLKNTANNFKQHNIPLDTLWSDVDYMINSEVFTIDKIKFPPNQMKDLLNSYRWIPVINTGIKKYMYLNESRKYSQYFINDPKTQKPVIGKTKVGEVQYFDFFNYQTSSYVWKNFLDDFYSIVPFSGVWLNQNEFFSLCDGPCSSPVYQSEFDYSKDIPYNPGAVNIETNTISLNSTHQHQFMQADVHNYNGLLSTLSTYQFMNGKTIYPFILSRSSTLGSNKYSFHWTGENTASWQSLKSSIADILNNQLWGTQMTGADICGYSGNSTAELCARWYQLGSLYPFARNHNKLGSSDQEPFAFGDNQEVVKSASVNLKLRYSLLKQMYTFMIVKKGLGTFWQPMFFYYFPQQGSKIFGDEVLNTQFTIGQCLLVAPILEQGKTSRTVYIPLLGKYWYDFYTGKRYIQGTYEIKDVKTTDKVPLFIQGFSAIFTQDTTKVLQTKDLDNHFIATIAVFTLPYTEPVATGRLLAIDNYTEEAYLNICYTQGCFYYVYFVVYKKQENQRQYFLQISVKYEGMATLPKVQYLDGIRLFYEKTIEMTFDEPLKIFDGVKYKIDLPNYREAQNLQTE